MSSITRQQFQELRTLEEFDYGEFIRRLELYTGIKAVPCTAYQFYDDSGDYICDSCDSLVDDMMTAVYVMIHWCRQCALPLKLPFPCPISPKWMLCGQ